MPIILAVILLIKSNGYNLTTTSMGGLLLGYNSKFTTLIYNDLTIIVN